MEEPGICVVDDDPSVLRSLRELLGSDGPNVRTRALEGGAFAFLVKPFDDGEFLDAVRGALGEPD